MRPTSGEGSGRSAGGPMTGQETMTAVMIYAWLTVGELTVLGILLTEKEADLRCLLPSVILGTAGALLLGSFAWFEAADDAWWGPAGVSLCASMLGAGAGLAVVLAWRRWGPHRLWSAHAWAADEALARAHRSQSRERTHSH